MHQSIGNMYTTSLDGVKVWCVAQVTPWSQVEHQLKWVAFSHPFPLVIHINVLSNLRSSPAFRIKGSGVVANAGTSPPPIYMLDQWFRTWDPQMWWDYNPGNP